MSADTKKTNMSNDCKSTETLLSIIMPMKNVERFLGQAIESVLDQTHTCWELIIIDDGSIDMSVSIAKGYQGKAPERIQITQGEAKGAAAARRKGLTYCSGEIVIFLDADDYFIDPNAFGKISRVYTASNADIILFDAFQESKGGRCADYKMPTGTVPINEIRRICCTTFDERDNTMDLGYTCLKAVKRKLFEEISSEQWERVLSLRTKEDRLLTLFLLDSARSIYCINEVFYFYRANDASLTRSISLENWLLSANTVEREIDSLVEKWTLSAGTTVAPSMALLSARRKEVFRLIPSALEDEDCQYALKLLRSSDLGQMAKPTEENPLHPSFESIALNLLYTDRLFALKGYMAAIGAAKRCIKVTSLHLRHMRESLSKAKMKTSNPVS